MDKVRKLINNVKAEMKYWYIKNLNLDQYEGFLEQEYKKRTGEALDLDNPQKYTEKVQYAKLYLNSPMKTKLADKYLVRDWVTEKIGSDYLIPLLGAWDNFSEINFEELPNRFVLKFNSGSDTSMIVNDKEKFDFKDAKKKFDHWVKTNFGYYKDIQLHYKEIKPKIIAEEYIEDANGHLPEFKFFCFDGKVYYCWFIMSENGEEYRNVYDLNWNLQEWNINKIYKNYPESLPKPKNFDEMVEIAEILSQGFSHVRVDLYNVDNKIYFGEMTFTSGGGYSLIYPEEYNYRLGDLWDLKQNN